MIRDVGGTLIGRNSEPIGARVEAEQGRLTSRVQLSQILCVHEILQLDDILLQMVGQLSCRCGSLDRWLIWLLFERLLDELLAVDLIELRSLEFLLGRLDGVHERLNLRSTHFTFLLGRHIIVLVR